MPDEAAPKPGENASQFLDRLIKEKKGSSEPPDDRPRATLTLSDVRWAARSGAMSGLWACIAWAVCGWAVVAVFVTSALWFFGVPRPW